MCLCGCWSRGGVAKGRGGPQRYFVGECAHEHKFAWPLVWLPVSGGAGWGPGGGQPGRPNIQPNGPAHYTRHTYQLTHHVGPAHFIHANVSLFTLHAGPTRHTSHVTRHTGPTRHTSHFTHRTCSTQYCASCASHEPATSSNTDALWTFRQYITSQQLSACPLPHFGSTT